MTTHLKIEGMTCGHCVATVKKALEAVPGVQSAQVSLSERSAEVVGTVPLTSLVEAVDAEGYAASIRKNSPSTGTCSCCTPNSNEDPQG